MTRTRSDEPEQPKKLATYTLKLDDAQMNKLRGILQERGWTPFEVAYSRFAFRADHVKVDRKSTRLNSSHVSESRMPSSA